MQNLIGNSGGRSSFFTDMALKMEQAAVSG